MVKFQYNTFKIKFETIFQIELDRIIFVLSLSQNFNSLTSLSSNLR